MTVLLGSKSERLRHALLASAAEQVMHCVRKMVSKGKTESFVIAWPSGAIRADGGAPIDGPCLASLKGVAQGEWRRAVCLLAKRTDAYALLVVEQKEGHVQGSFESPYGAEGWRFDLERHGDVWVAGPLTKRLGVSGLFFES